MTTDNRIIINGLDSAGDVLAAAAIREGGFRLDIEVQDDGAVRFLAIATIRDNAGKFHGVSGAAPTLPGALLKLFEARAEKQAEIDAEAAKLAEFEAWKAQQAEQEAA